MFIAALFTTAKIWKQLKCSPTDEWIDNVTHTYIYMCVCVICMCVYTHTHTHTCMCMLSCFSHVQLFATLWTIACQAPLSMGFSRQEDWSGLPCPPLGDLPDPGIKSTSLTSPALAGGFFTTRVTWEAVHTYTHTPHTQDKYTVDCQS